MSSIVSLLETHTIFCWVSPFWLVGSTYLIQQCLACMYVCTKHTSSTSYVALLNVCSSLQQRNRTRLILYLGASWILNPYLGLKDRHILETWKGSSRFQAVQWAAAITLGGFITCSKENTSKGDSPMANGFAHSAGEREAQMQWILILSILSNLFRSGHIF